ncbi:MAG: alpha/beta hydrolase [Ignavibacteriales bacterium]|nr:alpha/beta hydrolase [Ignavibacteriales bacterium]
MSNPLKFLLSFFLIPSIFISAQSEDKILSGFLPVGGKQIELIFILKENQKTIDVPAQYAFDMELTSAEFKGDSLFITLDMMAMKYAGKVHGSIDSISGVYTQGSGSMPLTLFPKKDYKQVSRTQKISPPYPYYTTDVVFKNEEANIDLAGTVTAPDTLGKYPAVILVTGSGPQDRDESLMGHKPFLVIADWLTRNGIVVLRYDDRGIGKSKGNFRAGTTMDFAGDASAALNHLATLNFVDKEKIGVIGHSEGGVIAPIVAVNNPKTRFIINLAGTGVKGRDIIVEQSELLARADSTVNEEYLNLYLDLVTRILDGIMAKPDLAARQIDSVYKSFIESLSPKHKEEIAGKEQFNKQGYFSLATPWFIQFLSLEPTEWLEKVKVPVLALWGSKDLQVPPLQSLKPVEKALIKSGTYYEIEVFESMNHLFQKVVTGGISEYSTTSTTIEPEVLKRMVEFIKKR